MEKQSLTFSNIISNGEQKSLLKTLSIPKKCINIYRYCLSSQVLVTPAFDLAGGSAEDHDLSAPKTKQKNKTHFEDQINSKITNQKVSYRYRTSGYCTKKRGFGPKTVNTRRVLLVHAPQFPKIADDINTNTQIQAIYRTIPRRDEAKEEKHEFELLNGIFCQQ